MRAVMTESWLLASTLLAGIGFASGSVALLVIGVLVFGMGGAARLWSRLSLDRVVYSRRVAEHRLFTGEDVEITLTLENQKILPVPWIEVRESLPRGMPTPARTIAGSTAGMQVLVRSTSLGANDRLDWPISLRALRRGFFRVGPTRLRSGDLFGFFERETETGRPTDGIVVYPRVYPLPDLGLTSARPFGDLRGGSRIFEDPSRVVGVRDYMAGDPMRRIDWAATARQGRLQSRLYEPSRSQSLVVALNIPTFERSWQGSDPVLLERGISVAASIARWAAEAGYALGLLANGSFPDADRTIRIGAGNRPDQLNRVLEALAMVTSFTTSEMADALEEPSHPLPAGATVVLVAALVTDELAGTLLRLRTEGHSVHVVKTSLDPWDRDLGRIPVIEVGSSMERLEREAIAEGTLAAPEGVAP